MNVYLATLGCRLNEAELATWQRELEGRGHLAVADPDAAQVMVVNSCAVTSEAARKSRKLVSSLRRLNPEAPVVLTGCYASLEAERAAALPGVDQVIDNRDKAALVSALETLEVPPEVPAEPLPKRRTRAFIKVADGCRNRCTFCIVTIARGQERSRSVTSVVDEIAHLAASGHREAVLTAVHLGGYGSDIGTDLGELVRAILRDTDIRRLRLSSLEPWDLPDDFHQLWSDRRLQPHLHLPLQAGCDATLKRMARRCPTARYRSLVESLRANVSDLAITTDLIVGFPGETDDEWRETMAFVEEIGFAHMHIFAFSAREGTAAARMRPLVSRDVMTARSRQMHELAARMKGAFLQSLIGSEREVLWEGSGEIVDNGRRFVGYTGNYLRAETIVAEGTCLRNHIGPARILGEKGGVLIARVEREEPRLLPVLG